MIAGFWNRGIVAVILMSCSLAGGAAPALAASASTFVPIAGRFDLRTTIAQAPPAPLVRTAFVPAIPRPLGAPMLASPISEPPVGLALPFPAPSTVNGYSTLPLAALVDANSDGVLDAEETCLATAVYFESKGEPLEGQLAVAHVVMNRAVSGRYPTSLCGVVRQRAQFSFVRRGLFPRIDQACQAWRKARAIARVARLNLTPALPRDVLWYHADYVTPRWRQALIRFEKVGRHIFYRA